MKRTFTLLSLAALLAAPTVTRAALSLDEAVAVALDNNHRLGAADAEVDASTASAREASAARLPKLSLAETFSRTDNPVLVFGNLLRQESFGPQNFLLDALNQPAPLNNFESRVTVEQPLWLGGRLRHAARAAEDARLAAVSDRERTRQEVVHAVIDAYTAAVVARAGVRVAGDALETARANTRLVADLHEGGLVVRSDLLQARVRESEIEEQLARAEAAAATALAALNLVMGQPLGRPLELPSALAAPQPSGEDLELLVQEARSARPDLEAADARVRAADRSIRLARSGRLPWIGLAGSVEANAEDGIGNDGTNWSLFASLKWSVLDRATRARIQRAEADNRKAMRMRSAAEQAVEIEVRRSYHEQRAAGKRIEQAAAAIVLAEESLRIVRDRYGEGLTTLVELLEAETTLTRARSRELAALRDAWLTDANLRLATGRL